MLNKRILVLVFLLVFLFLVGCNPAPPNQTPILTSDPITTATVWVEYTYDVNATDPDGDTLTYSLATKPSGMTINSANGLIKWTPTATQVGNNLVSVKVSDGALDITQSFLITVSAAEPDIELTGIVVDPRTMGLFVREKEAIKSVTAYYNDGTHADITLGDCIFVSSHPYQVLVSETGVVTAVAPPSATIFVSYTERGITKMDDVIVTVSAVTLDRIVVEPDKMTLFIGQSDFIKSITAHYIDGFEENIFLGDKFCKYTSSDKDVITVDDGLITAVGEGTAIATLSYFGKTDTVEVTVIKPIPDNQLPIASFTAIPTPGVVPLEVFFTASDSHDPDGTIISYAWNFKDGSTGNGQTISHTFASAGSYNVKLTVTDNEGATDSATKTIIVTDPITEPVSLGTPLTKDGIIVTVERIELIEPPLCGQAFEVEIYFSVINNSESTLRGPGRFDYVLDEKIYEDEFNSIGYLHIGDGISWIYPGQSRSVGYNYCFHSPVTINRFTWGASFEDYSQIELGPWEN